MISYLHSCSPLVITCGRCRLSSIMVLSSSEIHTQIQVQLHTLIYKSGGCDLIYKGNGALCDRLHIAMSVFQNDTAVYSMMHELVEAPSKCS